MTEQGDVGVMADGDVLVKRAGHQTFDTLVPGDVGAEVSGAVATHTGDASDAHDASAISILDTANDFTATDVEGALAELQSDAEAHLAAGDPHPTYLTESDGDARYGQLAAANTWALKQRIALAADGRGFEVKRVAGQTKNLMTFLSEASENGSETGSGSAVLARMDYQGGFGVQGLHVALGANGSGVTGTQSMWIQPFADSIHILADQFSGQTVQFLLLRRSDATKALEIKGDGTNGVGSIYGYAADGTQLPFLMTTLDAGISNGRAAFRSINATVTPLFAIGLAAGTQTADLQQWRNTTTIGSRINASGYFMTRKAAAPADGDLVSSELALWIDATNGACKLMVKAKQADGTVRTGSLALS